MRTSIFLAGLVLSANALAQTQPLSPAIAVSGEQVLEGNSGQRPLTFRLAALGQNLQFPVRVVFRSADGSALSPSDYLATQGEISIPNRETRVAVQVQIIGDTVVEATETVELIAQIVGSPEEFRGRGSIANDDGVTLPPIGVVQLVPRSIREGNSGQTDLVFDVRSSPVMTTPFTLTYQTEGGSATPGVDYLPATGSITVNPGEPGRTIVVKVLGDTVIEPNETVLLLARSTQPVIDVRAIGVILNDDGVEPPPPLPRAIVPIGGQIREPATGEIEGRFALRLTQPLSTSVTVAFSVDPASSASAGPDYVGPASGVVSFAANEVAKDIFFRIRADNVAEPTERIRINFSNPVGAVLARPFADLLIIDRQEIMPPPSGVAIVRCRPFVNEGDTARLGVRRIGDTSAAASVNYSTEEGTATEPEDFMAAQGALSWAAGDHSTRIITVQTQNDELDEQPEQFTIKLTGSSLIGPDRAPIIIRDSESMVNEGFESMCESTLGVAF